MGTINAHNAIPVLNQNNHTTFHKLTSSNFMSKKRSRMVETPTAKRIHSEPDRLWRIVTDYPDIFDSLIVPKLNGNDVKFFYDVNTESRVAIKRSSGRLCATFKICDFFTKSTLSWALEKCSEKKERFCVAAVTFALSGNLVMLKYLHENGCPWNEDTCSSAAQNGHLEILNYLHEE